MKKMTPKQMKKFENEIDKLIDEYEEIIVGLA